MGIDRRSFLGRALGGLSVALASKMAGLFPEARPARAERPPAASWDDLAASPGFPGELYGGFLLLPGVVPAPRGVEDAIYGPPHGCGVGLSREELLAQPPTSEWVLLETAKAIADLGRFPMYQLAEVPKGLRLRETGLLYHAHGALYSGSICYEAFDPAAECWYGALNLHAVVDFPHPFPIWDQAARTPEEIGGSLHKVSFVPGGQGLLIAAGDGLSLHWITDDTYYNLTTSDLPGATGDVHTDARNLVDRLSKVV